MVASRLSEDPAARVLEAGGSEIPPAAADPSQRFTLLGRSGNCHTAIVMIGEKCADLIKAAHGID